MPFGEGQQWPRRRGAGQWVWPRWRRRPGLLSGRADPVRAEQTTALAELVKAMGAVARCSLSMARRGNETRRAMPGSFLRRAIPWSNAAYSVLPTIMAAAGPRSFIEALFAVLVGERRLHLPDGGFERSTPGPSVRRAWPPDRSCRRRRPWCARQASGIHDAASRSLRLAQFPPRVRSGLRAATRRLARCHGRVARKIEQIDGRASLQHRTLPNQRGSGRLSRTRPHPLRPGAAVDPDQSQASAASGRA